jgi:hypothetical protein
MSRIVTTNLIIIITTMMMTKVWNDTSWSDRDSAEAMIGGEPRTLKITAIGRTRHGPKNV